MKSERDELQRIINRSELAGEWKAILQETFSALAERTDAVLADVRDQVLREDEDLRRDWSHRWNIVTAWEAADSATAGYAFRRLLAKGAEDEGEDFPLGEPLYVDICGDYFLDCAYEDVLTLCSDEAADVYPYRGCVEVQGESVPFRYRLAYDLKYIHAERLLFVVADLYRIKAPILFSPYGRRAVKIQVPRQDLEIVGVLLDRKGNLAPYCPKENRLADKLRIDRQLKWNLRTESVPLPSCTAASDRDDAFFSPYGNQEIYRYTFKDRRENDFICPSLDEAEHVIAAQKDVKGQQIVLVTKKPLTEPCRSLHIIQAADTAEPGSKPLGDAVFPNLDGRRKEAFGYGERLRTRGDIERMLYGLGMPGHGLTCAFRAVSQAAQKDVTPLRRYDRDLAYGRFDVCREQSLYGSRRGLPFCYITFSGDEKFLNDYAEYVLSFLEFRYPDFQWVGVR